MDNKTTIPAEEITRLKGLGFLHDKTTDDCFNARVITGNGMLSADEFRAIAKAAELYGNGNACMTTRLTIEVQRIPYKNIDAFIAFLAKNGLEPGGTGPKVRPIVSCKGTTCQYGLIDTYELSSEIHERFYKGYHQVKLPHKFKIAVGGCPNNCVKPELNDLGIIGQKVPTVDVEKCRSCKVCQVEKACPIKIAHLVDDKICINKDECNNCGRCDGKCPFGAVGDYKYGYRIYIGGRWGKKTAQAKSLSKIFTDKDEVLSLIDKTINYFKENGEAGERFADTINRIGFENVEKALLK
ncbi:MAG: (4Fe-4S)-binding protein [Candidatus Metalachnospira sp.]|nr:(4Fe-4S)-binding protein [Candidatus Metalachnospira sp.]